ncbi:MAG: SMP-30/gluconolactonase/LRE family protein [Spirosomataceae bacterium]
MAKPRRMIVGTLVLVIVLLVLKTLNDAGSFKTIKPHVEGTLQKVEGIAGVEDITIDQATGLALLSSDDRRAYALDGKPKKGGIFVLDLNDSLSKPHELTQSFREDFHPHGISLVKLTDGRKRLFVVNHSLVHQDTATIEIFDWQDSVLIHRETLKNPAYLPSPNDIVGVGERQFYVTNDHDAQKSFFRNLKDYLQIGTGYVAFYDGTRWQKTLASGIKYANGINISPDNTKLFVASTTGRSIFVYDINPASGAISPDDEIYLNTGVDNLEWDATGALWIGCHPQLLKFVSHSKDPKKLSPSQVLKLNYKGTASFDTTEVYLNDGHPLSGSSVGAVYKNQLLIGPVFERHLLRYWLKNTEK